MAALQKVAFPVRIRPELGISDIDTGLITELAANAGFVAAKSLIYLFEPGAWGANHRHPRAEAFAVLGELEFRWRDEAGEVHIEQLGGVDEQGNGQLVIVPSNLPHFVRNISDRPATMFELRDSTDLTIQQLEGAESLKP